MQRTAVFFAAALMLTTASTASAQLIRFNTPFHTINDSFYENIGVNFGFDLGPNAFFSNGLGSVPPQFGGHDPNSDAQFGFRAGRLSLNLTAGQGSTRNMTSQIPSVVVPNGYGGSVSDTSQRPFVTGIIPVVGAPSVPHRDRSAMIAGIQQAKRAYEAREAERLSELRKVEQAALAEEQRRLGERNGASQEPPLVLDGSSQPGGDALAGLSEDDELFALVNKARQLEEAGKNVAARLYYQQAARTASGPLKGRLRAKIRSLKP